ncbi:hypothetical protein TNCV_4699691 [Trichonephila clavipes]|nr:hypothetical protein TNCV_4699691 [Trichonephila clavipes]
MQHHEGSENTTAKLIIDIMLCKDRTIKSIASSDMCMVTKPAVSIATNVDYNRCHTPRHKIEEALNVLMGDSSPFDFYILQKLTWCSNGCSSMNHTF